MRTFAEIDADRRVLRVVVCNDPDWLADHLGGEWVETHTDDETVTYCGAGFGHDPDWPCRFAPQWVQPTAPDEDGAWPYNAGSVVFDEGRIWVSTINANVHRPGVSGWRHLPTTPGVPPDWVQPSGSHDPWQVGEHVMHAGKRWVCVQGDAQGNNVWEPGTFGWEEVT